MSGVVWARRSFRMVLNGKYRQLAVAHAFDAIVVEVDVGDFNFLWQCLSFDGKAMIMRGDFHVAVAKILDRLIAAAMTKHKFESFAAKRAPQQLMAKANTKDRHT